MNFKKTEIQMCYSGLVYAGGIFWLYLSSRTENIRVFKVGCLKAAVINTIVTAEVYAIMFT